jgi:hypothetical protein
MKPSTPPKRLHFDRCALALYRDTPNMRRGDFQIDGDLVVVRRFDKKPPVVAEQVVLGDLEAELLG